MTLVLALLTAATAAPTATVGVSEGQTWLLLDDTTPEDVVAIAVGTSGLAAGGGACLPEVGCTDVVDPTWFGPVARRALGRGVTALVPLPLDLDGVGTVAVQVFGSASGTSSASSLPVVGLGPDPDGDGLGRVLEAAYGGDPRLADTDGDRLDDRTELQLGTRLDLADTDGDGIRDGLDPAPLDPSTVFPPPAEDVVLTAPGVEIRDPEIDSDSGQIVWQQFDGSEVWVADLDPSTGALVPSDGRGTLVATTVAPMSDSANGPEWMQGPSGPEVVVPLRGGRVVRGVDVGGSWVGTLVDFGTPVVQPFGTTVPGTPWLRALTGIPMGDLVVQRADGVGRETFRRGAAQARWAEDRIELVFTSLFGGDVASVGHWGPTTGFRRLPLADPGVSQSTPSLSVLHGQQLLLLGEGVVGDSGVPSADRLARFVETPSGFVRAETIWGPPALPWVESPEVFRWDGRLYVVYAASSEPWQESSDFRVLPWVRSIDGATPVVDQPACGRVPVEGRDPEVFTGGDAPWLYYTRTENGRTLHRCTLAL